jgi:aminoglycoside phosphotransferase (APT) family kinase protein
VVEHVSRHLDHQGFPQVLARSGLVLLMEWIEGSPLNLMEYGPVLVRRCGALQGSMHIVPVPPDSPYRPVDTIEDWHGRLHLGLDELAAAQVLEKHEARQAFDAAMAYAPSTYAVGFVHRDFCAENLVLRRSGGICAVDNEALAVDPYDYDLGRTWYRWPMSALQRQAYLQGYESYRSSTAFLRHFPYWGIAALAGAAVFRLEKQRDAASVPIGRLRGLLGDLARGISGAEAFFHS